MTNEDEEYLCPDCGWAGNMGELEMVVDSDGDATGFECPACGGSGVGVAD